MTTERIKELESENATLRERVASLEHDNALYARELTEVSQALSNIRARLAEVLQ